MQGCSVKYPHLTNVSAGLEARDKQGEMGIGRKGEPGSADTDRWQLASECRSQWEIKSSAYWAPTDAIPAFAASFLVFGIHGNVIHNLNDTAIQYIDSEQTSGGIIGCKMYAGTLDTSSACGGWCTRRGAYRTILRWGWVAQHDRCREVSSHDSDIWRIYGPSSRSKLSDRSNSGAGT